VSHRGYPDKNAAPIGNTHPFVSKARKSADCGQSIAAILSFVMKLNDCPVSRTLRFFDGKWKPLILNELKAGRLRAGELARRIPEVTPKVLTQQLRELESDGVVSRLVLPRVPPHVEYALSPFGLTLRPLLNSLCKWGEDLAEGRNPAAPEPIRLASKAKH
jgi:DNA-binding HxlR family transcriptional regulator